MRYPRGFTLIELSFVTAILALLVALAVPRFNSTVERLRLEQSITHLNQTLRAARGRAAAESRTFTWTWDDESHQSYVEATAANGSIERFEDNSSRAKLDAAVTIEMLRENKEVECRCVAFYPDGSSEPTTTLILAKRQEQTYTITVHETTGSSCLAKGAVAC